MARPSKYTKKLGERICKELISGKSLRQIGKNDWAPHFGTIANWLAKDGHPFREQYAQARRIQAEIYGDDLVADAKEAAQGDTQRARLIVDTKKWVAAKLLPKRYGETVVRHEGKIEHDHKVALGDDLKGLLGDIYQDKG